MILDYISPSAIYRKFSTCITELLNYRKFKRIVRDLNNNGRLNEVGIKADLKSNMYIGIDLNPELLLYSETSQESVELRLISEKMTKYNDFLTKEGILDAIKVDYERVQNDSYYGYILQISFNFKTYNRFDLIYSSAYFLISIISIILGVLAIL